MERATGIEPATLGLGSIGQSNDFDILSQWYRQGIEADFSRCGQNQGCLLLLWLLEIHVSSDQ